MKSIIYVYISKAAVKHVPENQFAHILGWLNMDLLREQEIDMAIEMAGAI
ncbi:MAG: hypothetical protein NTV58_09435 [Deltaproteobacteria bacterium]|nr:hypothetical protein [Deltaproteobacteria bacterium]